MAPKITHCIFDMDGLLLDTERVYTEVTSTILARYGVEFTYELKAPMMGAKAHAAAEYLLSTTGVPLSVEDYLTERNQMQLDRFPDCEPLPGVVRLIQHLKRCGVPIAVATGSYRAAYELKTQRHQALFSLFDVVVLSDDPAIKQGKPAPDLFEEARKRLGAPDPAHCLVFEDAINGVQAAHNAGMPVIWIPDPRANRDITPAPTEIIDSLEHFDLVKYGLPAFE
ncbi:HAD-like domain-containing protein [Thamnocephalis sphaerospora]|uniref:HAD-like domain-containing protein n=1 Tax=Thamnocephalis sphaerospora TaxID=78915 RepID=A0A4P9XL42_9FUNG|nr:HAD-like domain-containing protein [Thamnocephalis sphaerospora]|eukprot:RKP06564.1 HAD-like domain-containing protein [Thamnocephalis sphaerospora]